MNAALPLPAAALTAVNLDDYEQAARQRLPAATWARVFGAAADEYTARANRADWAALRLLPRVLRAGALGHTRVQLLGRDWPTPLLAAPMAGLGALHPGGDLALARACAAQGAGLVVSEQSGIAIETLAQAVRAEPGRGPLLMQITWHPDRGWMRQWLARIAAAGFDAVVLTVDAPVQGVRDAERRAGPAPIPPCPNLQDRPPLRPNPAAGLCGGWGALAPSWDAVAQCLADSALPLWLKGVLHPDDARQAAALGTAGVIVSNHGGRVLDTAVSTAWALPRVADAVGDALPLLVDGGLRRGTDVLKALALGARAVLLGRPLAAALAAGGALAVARAWRLLRDEFEAALLLTGTPHPAAARRDLLAVDPAPLP